MLGSNFTRLKFVGFLDGLPTASDLSQMGLFSMDRMSGYPMEKNGQKATSLDGTKENSRITALIYLFVCLFVCLFLSLVTYTRLEDIKVAFFINGENFGFVDTKPSCPVVYPVVCVSYGGSVSVKYGCKCRNFMYPPSPNAFSIIPIGDVVAKAFDNPKYFPDVCFVFQSSLDVVLAHKALLCARSKFFRSVFSKASTAGPKVKVEVVAVDEDPAMFKRIIRYMYSGKMVIESKMDAITLIGFAVKYSLDFLLQRAQAALTYDFESKNFLLISSMCDAINDKVSIADIMTCMDRVLAEGLSVKAAFESKYVFPENVITPTVKSAIRTAFNMKSSGKTTFLVAEPAYMLKNDFAWLINNPCFSDVSISVSSNPKEVVHCHRFMLSLFSFYFKNVFQGMFMLTEKPYKWVYPSRKPTSLLQMPLMSMGQSSACIGSNSSNSNSSSSSNNSNSNTISIAGINFPRSGESIKIDSVLISRDSVVNLVELGFSPRAAVWAMLKTDLNVERAGEWLFMNAFTPENDRELGLAITRTITSMMPPPQKSPNASANSPKPSPPVKVKRGLVSYCSVCMSLIPTETSVRCEYGCILCENCFLAEFRKGAFEGMERGFAFPQKVPCIVPGCIALHSTENVFTLLKTNKQSLEQVFPLAVGQRGLSLAERSMRRAPFSLVFPSEVMSLRGLTDYVRWVYSGNDINASVFCKSWNEMTVNVAMNAGDMFRDERYKEEVLVNPKLTGKLGLDFAMKALPLLADGRRCLDMYMAAFMDDLENTVIEFDKRKPWSKEFAFVFLGYLEQQIEMYIELSPFAVFLAYKYSILFPEEPLFKEKYTRFTVSVNA